ncbi:MAG TPA: 1,4-alpha-glucan branching enzyme, partial [Pseudoalteromonas sp.]|nr:1,4-alpha-glucan branching enzyme [Pseudoalteromonas sp.]
MSSTINKKSSAQDSSVEENSYDAQVHALNTGRFKDPFSFLGAHKTDAEVEIRLYLPCAINVSVTLNNKSIEAQRYQQSDLFIAKVDALPTAP